MAEFSIQHAAEIVDGPTYIIHASHLNDNFNAIISDFADRLSKVSSSAQSVTSAMIWNGAQTFSSSVTGSGAWSLSGTVAITGTFNAARATDPGTPTEGMFWVNTTSHLAKFYNGTATKTLVTTDDTLTRGFIAGLGLTTGTDTLNDIDIAVGSCRDATDAVNMVLAATLTKRSDAAWAVGSGNGGMDTGAKPNSGTLHIWLIKRSDTGVVDALFSTSASSPTMPANYDYKRLIGSRRTDSSGNIINMHQYGDLNLYDTPPALDVDVSNQSTTAVSRTLSTPAGRKLEAIVNVYTSSGSAHTLHVSSLDTTDAAPSKTATPLASIQVGQGSGGTRDGGGQIRVMTDTSNAIRTRSDTASTTVRIATIGWVDRRGKDD